jgi:TonB family protein
VDPAGLPRAIGLLAWIWFAGVAARAIWLGAGFARLRHLTAGSVEAQLDEDVESLRRALAPAAVVRRHERVTQPVAFGIRRPVILLPPRLDDLASTARRAVICHELLHVQRRDWLWLLAEETIRTTFWFHPGVRWALRHVEQCREQYVDELVILHTSVRHEYMEALVTLSEPPAEPMPCLALVPRRSLHARLTRLANARMMSPIRLVASIAALVFVVAATSIAAVSAIPIRQGAAQSDEKVYTSADGIQMPVATREVRPQYRGDAMARRIEGRVVLECVVTDAGLPSRIRVTAPLDKDLDAAAVEALEQWRFRPGTKDGKAVAVRVSFMFTFTLK